MQSILYVAIAFAASVILMMVVLPGLRRLKFGQSIREEGPQHHQVKAGTPTMGGVVFLLSTLILFLPFLSGSVENAWLLFLLLSFGAIGFVDDFIKVVMKRNLGLTSKQKIVFQLIVSILAFVFLTFMDFDTTLPVIGDLKWGYVIFFIFLLIGTSNATNLTDGLDGLLAGTSTVALIAYSIIAAHMGMHEVSLFALITAGGVLGFLAFNKNPAKVFMGDTGSLALGGLLAGLAVLTKTEFVLVIIGGVFVIETLSVILQVFFFKWKKKRIFKMSPIHHHFEYSGWSERKVVSTFCLTGTILAALGVWIAL